MGILRTLLAFLFAVTGAIVVVFAFLVAFVGFFLGGIIIVFAFFYNKRNNYKTQSKKVKR